MLGNFKIKYDGLQTIWVYKDHTNPKDILNKKTIVLYKQGSMIDFCIGSWRYEPDTREKLISLTPIQTEIVKVKNPKICFYIKSHKLYYKKDKEKCFDLANKKIENIIKEFVADDNIQTSTRKSTINNSESIKT